MGLCAHAKIMAQSICRTGSFVLIYHVSMWLWWFYVAWVPVAVAALAVAVAAIASAISHCCAFSSDLFSVLALHSTLMFNELVSNLIHWNYLKRNVKKKNQNYVPRLSLGFFCFFMCFLFTIFIEIFVFHVASLRVKSFSILREKKWEPNTNMQCYIIAEKHVNVSKRLIDKNANNFTNTSSGCFML